MLSDREQYSNLSIWWLRSSRLSPFYLTHVPSSFCRHLRAHHSEPIADPAAFRIVYAHRSGGLKGHFYDATVSTRPNHSDIRNRAEHARKRKMASYIISLERSRA